MGVSLFFYGTYYRDLKVYLFFETRDDFQVSECNSQA